MKIYLGVFACIFMSSWLRAQDKFYWQQKSDYTIQVTLDTALHQLQGHLSLDYRNASPDTLMFIWFHLWPEAYSARNTEFSKRQTEAGNTDFYFAPKSDYGGMDSLSFQTGGHILKISPHPEWADVVQVHLHTLLLPGEKVTITSPFRTRIPKSFSRLGREGSTYQISQWYPKPAVYDHKGWHPMPYLDQGEFFSTFGSFTVDISVPGHYVVAASGICQDSAEVLFLKQVEGGMENNTKEGYRTFRYYQDSIHDFAWFADPDFRICSREFSLSSGKKITARAFYRPENEDVWQHACTYLERSILWYSACVGEYPYTVVSAVDGALSAGGGMEYPTLTVIGAVKDTSDLEEVLLHEVGHNWFYGILASHERLYPWMDEGINSYYEHRYKRKQRAERQEESGDGIKTVKDGFSLNLSFEGDMDNFYDMAWRHLVRTGNSLPSGSPSENFSSIGYGIIAYKHASRQMDYLEAFLGTELLDSAMQIYYSRWAFKHPYPEDLKAVLEEVSRQNLDWFFHELIQEGKAPEFSVKRVRRKSNQVFIRNLSSGKFPVQVSWMLKDSSVYSVWTHPFKRTFLLDIPQDLDFDRVQLNKDNALPELNPKNNSVRNTRFLPKLRPPALGFLPLGEDARRFRLFIAPVIGANSRDGGMAGIMLGNQLLPSPRFRFLIMPMYGFRSREMTGSIFLRKDFIPAYSPFRRIRLAYVQDAYAGMLRIRPEVSMVSRLKDFGRSPEAEIRLAWNSVWTQPSDLPFLPARYDIMEVNMGLGNSPNIKGWHVNTGIRWYPEHFLLWENQARGHWQYHKKAKVKGRVYTGYFLNRQQIDAPFQLGFSGSTDYLMQQVFLDRKGTTPYYKALVNQTDGQQGAFGAFSPLTSDRWMYALNLKLDIPYTPFLIFCDLGTMAYLKGRNFMYDAGLGIALIPDIWEIYFPFLGSMYNNDRVSFHQYGQNIRFLLRLNALTPDRLIEKIR